MSNTFRVNDLIANDINAANFSGRNISADNLFIKQAPNLVFDFGNQKISGVKTFTDIISGNILTLYTGVDYPGRPFYPAVYLTSFPPVPVTGDHDNQLFTWRRTPKTLMRAYNGYMLNYDSIDLNYSIKKASYDIFLQNNDFYDTYLWEFLKDNYYNNDISRVANTIDITANVTLQRYNNLTEITEYFVGNYQEKFLIHRVETPGFMNPIVSYKINNVANTTNAVNAIDDLATSKPAGGWISLICTNGDDFGDGDIFIRTRGHTNADTDTYTYESQVSYFIETYQSNWAFDF